MNNKTIGVIAIALLVVTIAGAATQVYAHDHNDGRYAHRDTTVVRGPENTYINREGSYYGPNGYAHRDTTIVVHKTPYQRNYELGWANGYNAHISGWPYLNLALSQAYARGYTDGWNAAFRR